MSKDNNKLALVKAEDLSFVENNSLNEKQLSHILKKTPTQYVKTRPAKGGGNWDYVTGGYVKKCLNLMFGWDWDFEILDEKVMFNEAIVKGRLTCRSNGKTIIKMQFGNKDIMYKKQTQEQVSKGLEKIPLSIGNDLKAAATDCLKKCASEIGIASDIYNKEDFREVRVDMTSDEEKLTEIKLLLQLDGITITEEDRMNIERIVDQKEAISYNKCLKLLNDNLPKIKEDGKHEQ
jgi:hypothetical protein